MNYINIRDRTKCSATCRDHYAINYSTRSPITDGSIVCTDTACTRTYFMLKDICIDCYSCSLYTSSLYYKLVAFCTKHSLPIVDTDDGCDNIDLTNPTAQCLVELNSILKEYS